MQLSLTAEEIIAVVQPREIRGTLIDFIRGVEALDVAVEGELSFLANPKYKEKVAVTKASVLLLPLDYTEQPPPGQAYLLVENPSLCLARVCARIEQQLWPKPAPGIHPTAVIAFTAKVSATATIGPYCLIEDDVVIGDGTYLQAQVSVGRGAALGRDCWIMPGVTIAAQCTLGHRVRLQPGVVVGSDGFGYEFTNGRHEKLPQVGRVEIGDDVEIGANSTIDRARFSRTVIGEGTKIDNLVQIGHNVIVGKHCILCAQVGVAGSVTIEDYVVLAGQVGVAGHLTIGKGAKVGGQTGVNVSVAPKAYMNGTPMQTYMADMKLHVLQRRLPDLFRRFDLIEEHLKKSSA